MITVQILPIDPDLVLPSYNHAGDAGMDLRSSIRRFMAPGERVAIPTGVAMAIPPGYAGFVKSRSGLARHHGIAVLTGTVDCGFRGEWDVILLNTSEHGFNINRGDRIAQVVFKAVEHVELSVVAELPESERGLQGYGSSGR